MTSTLDADPGPGTCPSIPVSPWIVLAAFTVLMIAASVLDRRYYPDQDINPAAILGIVSCMAGHGLFMAADLSRRKKPVQRWWLLGAICPPVGIWIYLVAEYLLHAFYLVPATILYYLGLGLVPGLISGG